MSSPQFVIFLGVPGAGKGTQVKRLAQATGLPHISTGDLFRMHLHQQTELGRLAQGYMNEGVLVPDDVTVRMVQERLTDADCQVGALLDGFPRSLAQAAAMTRIAQTARAQCQAVYLDLDNSECQARITGRRQCRDCGAMFHILFQPPQVSAQCDTCGGSLYQREDDTAETAQKRMLVYYQETSPLLGYYYAQNALHTIDATGSPDMVAARVWQWWQRHIAGATV